MMTQPRINHSLMQRLSRVAAAYEMTTGKMLTHILTAALDELEGKEDEYTICTPVEAKLDTPRSGG